MNSLLAFETLAELMKLQGLAAFAFLALGKPLPFLPSSLAFLAAMGTARAMKRGRSRILLVHALAHSGAYLLALWAAWGRPGPGSTGEWIEFAAMAGALAVFWLRALWLEGIPLDHAFCAERFDEGLLLFLGALTLSAITGVRQGTAQVFFIPFLAFSILALGAARTKEEGSGAFPPLSRNASALRIALGAALGGLGIGSLAPALAQPARNAAGALKTLGAGALDIIARFLVWLFKPRASGRAALQDSQAQPVGKYMEEAAEESSLFSTIVMWVILGAAAVFTLILLGWLVLRVIRALGRKVEGGSAGAPPKSLLALLYDLILRLLKGAAALALRLSAGRRGTPVPRSSAKASYLRLLKLGRMAGLPRRASETPRRYALRLSRAFPKAAGVGPELATLLEKEIFGEKIPGPRDEARAAELGRSLHAGSFLADSLASGSFRKKS